MLNISLFWSLDISNERFEAQTSINRLLIKNVEVIAPIVVIVVVVVETRIDFAMSIIFRVEVN